MHPVLILLLAVAIVLVGILWLRLHAFLALLLAGFTVSALTPRAELAAYAEGQVERGAWTEQAAESFVNANPAERLADGFGSTAASIGILIAMAAIIGKCLLDSGAADRIVRETLRLVGSARASLAFLGSGFVLAIPVFFDTVFYLLIPLGKAMWLRTGKNYLLYVLSIVAGATMAHSLVPPTPGPLLVADELGVGILTMAVGGCIVGLASAGTGYLCALALNRRIEIPLRESSDISIAELEALAEKKDAELPPLVLSLAPILLPFALIALGTAIETIADGYAEGTAQAPAWIATVRPITDTLGDKNVALTIAAALALAMLAWKARIDRAGLASAVRSALASAGTIILITSAGGAFGATIRQGGVSDQIAALAGGGSALVILPLAFLVTAMIRTAQGSATVAMITAVGVLAPLADVPDLGFHPVYLALAIGCGSKPISWMADSGFWVICQMSGLTEVEGLKTVSPMTAVMGAAGLVVNMIGALLLPMPIG